MKYYYEMEERMWEINRCRFIFVLALAGTMWLLGWGEQAWSASAVSQFFLGQRNAGSGNNAEYMINLVDTPSTPCQSTGDKRRCAHMGDIFIGMIDLGVLEDQTGGGGHHNLGSSTANDELTGLIALKITTQTLVPKLGGGSEADQSLGPVNPATDIFGPTGAVAKGQMSAGLAAIIGAWNPGTIIALYDDPAKDFTRVRGCLIIRRILDPMTATQGKQAQTLGYQVVRPRKKISSSRL
jgi:hypothetical protein